jgi:acyl carrier protein
MISTDDLLKTIQLALNLDKNVTLDDSVDTIKEWDSLGQLAVLVAIDKRLSGKAAGIKMLASCQSVKAFVNILSENHLLQD